jgi:hypothetical protein
MTSRLDQSKQSLLPHRGLLDQKVEPGVDLIDGHSGLSHRRGELTEDMWKPVISQRRI